MPLPSPQVCINWSQLPATAACAADVHFTYLLYPGSQLKIDQGVCKSGGLGDFDGLVVIGTELAAQDEQGICTPAVLICNGCAVNQR